MVALFLAAALFNAAPDGGRAPRTVSDVRLLYFHASWCPSCKRFDAGGALQQVQRAVPGLTVESVDSDADVARLERYGVATIPTLVLVDADGFPLGRPLIELDEPGRTADRVVRLVAKMTKSKGDVKPAASLEHSLP